MRPRYPTADELAVLRGISEGKPQKQIAKELSVPLYTVQDRLDALRDEHGIRKSAGLVALAFREGWLK